MERKQILSKSGEPGIRYILEERIDDEHNIVLMAVPTTQDLEKVRQMRIKEALLADPTLGGKISEPVWEGDK